MVVLLKMTTFKWYQIMATTTQNTQINRLVYPWVEGDLARTRQGRRLRIRRIYPNQVRIRGQSFSAALETKTSSTSSQLIEKLKN